MSKKPKIPPFGMTQNFTAWTVFAIGIAVNLILSATVTYFKLPLYLDTVGTILAAVIGGYLPGVAVGFSTNLIKNFYDPSSIYYGVLNVIIAVAATNLFDRGWFRKIRGLIFIILIFTFIGGGLGSLIPWFMEGLTYDSESLSGILYNTGFFTSGMAHFLSSIIMDLPDKSVSVLTAALILRLIPKKYYHALGFESWMQTPVPEEVSGRGMRSNSRVVSVRTKVLLVLGVSLITVSAASVGTSMTVYKKANVKDHTELAQGVAKIAASIIDGNRVDDYLKYGEEAEGYLETKYQLMKILENVSDISYLYAYRIEEDGCHVIFDIDTADTPGDVIGDIIPFDKGFKDDKIKALLRGEEIDPIITNDKFGHLLTAYEPVYATTGRCVCYVGADVDIGQLDAMERSFLAETTTVFLGFFILMCAIVIWFSEYHLIYPIRSITKCMDEFSFTDNSKDNRDDDVKKIRNLNIHTGDEVEKLYNSLCRMTVSQTEQVRSIRRLSSSTSKMQDGLIITMADMVENRDADTGAHIQKTSAYVKIIVEGLRKKGYYAEKVTPKFISDVVRSAPLHDVGKINIPDGILNKPGPLNDEEFEIMKSHTVQGRNIIEHAIGSVEGDNYLKEARNMAAYHHERWDGKGYPEGIHGEVIPLSARIMAVADVFDALTSARVYKPALTLDEAIAALEEGKGTQFDPKCVEVFIEALPEVKVILSKYNREG